MCSSNMGRDVHSLMLSIQHSLCRPRRRPPTLQGALKGWFWRGWCGPTKKLILLRTQSLVLCLKGVFEEAVMVCDMPDRTTSALISTRHPVAQSQVATAGTPWKTCLVAYWSSHCPVRSNRPRSGQGQVRRRPGQDQVRPRSGQDQIRPRSDQDQVRPRSGQDQVRPRSGQDQIRRRSGQDQVRPKSSQGQVRPRSGQGQVRPRSGQGGIRIVHPVTNNNLIHRSS